MSVEFEESTEVEGCEELKGWTDDALGVVVLAGVGNTQPERRHNGREK